MFTPLTFASALLMMIISAACWGSWANTFKGVKNYRFELFYWDYAVGIFLTCLLYALTMGSISNGPDSFLHNVHSADGSNIGWALFAGVIFNLANLLLVAAIDMAGLSIAFPVAIGIALVVGVVLSYAQQRQGFVRGAKLAVRTAIENNRDHGRQNTDGEKRQVALSRKSIVICIISGVLMGLWAPFSTRALTHGNPLGPYSVAVFLTLGALLSCFLWNIYFMKHPLVGEPVAFSGLFRGPVSGHVLGLIGGAIWATGTVFNLVAAHLTGVAVSYAIGQAAPMVAALWGILVWKEFEGANRKAKAYLALMFMFYFLAILLIARATTS